jgi:hypothetical protein
MNRRDFFKFAGAATIVPAIPTITTATPVAKDRFSFGIPSLDQVTGGGIKPGETAVVIGFPNSGKTAFCRTVGTSLNTRREIDMDRSFGHEGSWRFFPDSDFLILRKDGSFHYVNDVLRVTNTWDGMANFAKLTRQKAVEENCAIIWCLGVCYPIIAQGAMSSGVLSAFSAMRHCDYTFMLSKTSSGDSHVNMVKNRHGKRINLIVKCVNNGHNKPILKEVE